MMTAIGTVLLAFVVLVGILAIASLFRRTIVYEYERGLRFSKGRLKGVLEPGAYWHYAGSTMVQKIDTRPQDAPSAEE